MNDANVITIRPGECYVTERDEIIKTLLGSCVAACLYDPENRVIGMNHFLLASDKNTTNSNVLNSRAGFYGINAMELLINAMMKKGANRNKMKAKVFGGGNVLKSANGVDFFNIGTLNAKFITDFMANEKIPIVSQSLGGDIGRIIYFDAHDFSVAMKVIGHEHTASIVKEEKRFVTETLTSSNQQQKTNIFL